MDVVSILLPIAVIWTVVAVTPGPNFFVTAQISASVSRSVAAYAVLGIVTGTAIWGSGGAIGVHLIFSYASWTYTILKTLGGAYLIFLGVRFLLPADLSSRPGQCNTRLTIGRRQAWYLGLLTILSNPKTAVFTVSLFAANLPPSPPLWLSATAVGIMMTISFVWYGAVAYLFGTPGITLLYRNYSKQINKITGLIFLSFGAFFVLEGLVLVRL